MLEYTLGSSSGVRTYVVRYGILTFVAGQLAVDLAGRGFS